MSLSRADVLSSVYSGSVNDVDNFLFREWSLGEWLKVSEPSINERLNFFLSSKCFILLNIVLSSFLFTILRLLSFILGLKANPLTSSSFHCFFLCYNFYSLFFCHCFIPLKKSKNVLCSFEPIVPAVISKFGWKAGFFS